MVHNQCKKSYNAICIIKNKDKIEKYYKNI